MMETFVNNQNTSLDFFGFNSISYINDFFDKSIQRNLEEMKIEFEEIDWKIKRSAIRMEKGWIIHGSSNRSLITPFGKIIISRTRYKNKYTNETKFLFDEYINLKKYKRVTPALEKEIISRAGNGNRYRDIKDAVRWSNISESTISKVIRNFVISDEALSELECEKIDLTNEKYLYIETDDTFTTLRYHKQKKKYCVRPIVYHTGSKKGFNSRNYLMNKRIDYLIKAVGTPIGSTETIKKIDFGLKKWFKNYDHIKLILISDGAKIFENIADIIGAKHVLDKFHLLKTLKTVFPLNKKYSCTQSKKEQEFFWKIKDAIFTSNSFEELESICEDVKCELFTWEDKSKYLEYIKKFMKYFNNKKSSIQNYFKDWSSSSSTEGQVSTIKHILGYGKKIFSIVIFKKFLNLLKLKCNGYKIDDLYEFDYETTSIEKNEYNFKYVNVKYKTVSKLNLSVRSDDKKNNNGRNWKNGKHSNFSG